MTERTSLLHEVGQAFRDNGLTAAITALVGGCLAIAATVTRKAFTNEAMLERLDRELHIERERIDKQRAEDRKADADRLERIETDMTERSTILQEVGQAFRDNGLTAAITALVGGCLAVAATVTRKAFTNEAMLERLDRELLLERDRIDKQRAEDRKVDADRLERIETDIRAMRDVMFEAFQRGRTD